MLNGEIKNYIAQIDAFKNIFKTNDFQNIVSTSHAIEKMAQQIVPSNITEKLKESRSILDSFANSFEPVLEKLQDTELQLLRGIESVNTTNRNHLCNINLAYSAFNITKLFLLSTNLASTLSEDLISKSFLELNNSLVEKTKNMFETYNHLLENESIIPNLEIIGYYTQDLFLHSVLTTTLYETQSELNEEIREEIVVIRKNFRDKNDELIYSFLDALNPDFSKALDGAKKACNEKGPDFIRQTAVSLRELLTAVIRHLAPDHQCVEWLNSQNLLSNSQYYYNGRSTRRARILFICRRMPETERKFIEKDVEATLALLDTLSNFTHSFKNGSKMPPDLSGTILRVEALLSTLAQTQENR